MSYWVIHQIQLFTTELEPHLRWKMISHYSLFHAYSECIHAHTLPLWGWETTHAHTILALILNTVDAEIFVGEIFRGLNFQEIQFLWMVAPTKFWTQRKFFVCEKFQCKWKWSRSTRRLSRIKARTFWEAAVGETVVCVLVPGNFHDRNAVAVEKDGRIIAGHLPRKVSHVHALFLKIAWWNRSLHCDWKMVDKTCSRWLTDYSTYSCNLLYHFSLITDHASRLVFRNDPEIKWPPQSMYYA